MGMNEQLAKKDKEMLIANSMKAIRDGESKKAFLKNTKFIIDGMVSNNYDLEEENFELKQQLQAYKEKEDKINSSELMEVLADIEHKRWSGWQEYLHSLCVKNEDGSLTIPKERVDWWNKEIETPYCDLEERLKEYDRDEVRKTLSAILQILNEGE